MGSFRLRAADSSKRLSCYRAARLFRWRFGSLLLFCTMNRHAVLLTVFGCVLLTVVSAFPATEQPDCSVGGSGLCSCSELIAKKIIKSFDDCTQEAAMSACTDGQCSHSSSVLRHVSSTTGQCAEYETEDACDDGKSHAARMLLGGHGGCAWCKSDDGAHQECFYKSSVSKLTNWTCTNSTV